MTRVGIRLRLTASFAVAMVLLMAAAGVFSYLRLRADLDESLTAGLAARTSTIASTGAVSAGAAGDAEESFAQRLSTDGEVIEHAGRVRSVVLEPGELRRAARGEHVLVERRVPGIEGTARVLARPGTAETVVVAGQSLDDRDEALTALAASFAIGGPIAVLIASLLGYALAAIGLAPIEAMRRRAGEISLAGDDDRLPLPAAHDEVRRLGETLNAMLARLQRGLERERRFVADASHELRTPVAVIKAELEAALRAGGHAPQVREALVAAVEECDNLAQLAEDLLVVARGESGLPLRPERLRVHALLDGVRDRFVDRAGERGREIRVDAPAAQTLEADGQRLRQALGNLVDNALRHGDGGVLLRASREHDGVVLEVRDGGPGFAADVAGNAFDRFARSDGARGGDGTGLGLAIVRAIAEAHGGRAELVPGPGACVRIWLPERPETASGRSQRAGVAS